MKSKPRVPYAKRLERWKTVCRLSQGGKTAEQIATQYHVTTTTVERWLSRPPKKQVPRPLPKEMACRICHKVFPIKMFYKRSGCHAVMRECPTCNRDLVITNNLRRWVKKHGIDAMMERILRHQELEALMHKVFREAVIARDEAKVKR